MTLLKNIFGATALLAVLSFSSFAATARPVCEVDCHTPGQEYLLHDSDLAQMEGFENSYFVYDRPTVQTIIQLVNYCTPFTIDSDYELTSLDMDSDHNVIILNATVDYATCLAIVELDDYDMEEFECEIAASIYELFDYAGPDDNGDSLIDFLKDSGIKVNYNFYIKGIDVPVKTFTINPQLIERTGLTANNIYSI